jgi:hypothetical protein
MNSKQVKQLRKKVKQFQLEWMKSLVSEEEAKKITLENITAMMPPDTHVKGLESTTLSYMSDKWVLKILKKHPDISTLQELLNLGES